MNHKNSFVRIEHGVTNHVYRELNQNIIRKVSHKKPCITYHSLSREIAALSFLSDHMSDCIPRVIEIKSANEIILTFLPGNPLNIVQKSLSSEERYILAASLGKKLAKIHQIKTIEIPNELDWPIQRTTWKDSVYEYFVLISRYIEKNTNELSELMEKCRIHLEKTMDCLNNSDYGLIHGDFGGANILIDSENLRISGVLDWEWSTFADPDMDLARIYWLNRVGRSAWLWSNEEERLSFQFGYNKLRKPETNQTKKIKWYGILFACSYLLVRLLNNSIKECVPLIEFLTKEIDQF